MSLRYDGSQITTALVPGGGNPWTQQPSISADGRFVAYSTWAALELSANGRYAVVASSGEGCSDNELVVVDVSDGSVERVDVSDDGIGAAQNNDLQYLLYTPSISGDGRYVAFKSNSYTLIPGLTSQPQFVSGAFDMATVHAYVRDLVDKSTSMLGMNPGDPVPGPVFYIQQPSISDDGTLVAMSNWSGGPGTLYERSTGTTRSVGFPYGWDHIDTWVGPAGLSGDGRYLAFADEYYVVYGRIINGDGWVERIR